MFRRSSVVRVVDELGFAQRREGRRGELEVLLVGVAWAAWSVRLELVLVVVTLAIQRLVGGPLGWAAVLVVVGLVLGVRPLRQWLVRLLYAMRVRRAWARATI